LCAWAGDFKPAKLTDIRDASEVGANTVTDSSEGLTGTPTYVPAMLSRCLITLELDGTRYTAVYPVNKHLKVTDFTPGELVPARIEGNKLVIKSLDGKELKAKISHREPLEKTSGNKPSK